MDSNLTEDGAQKVMEVPPHHAVFAKFRPFSGEVPGNHHADFIGSLISHDFVAGYGPPPLQEPRVEQPGYPDFNEEYFEWISLCEAVNAASDLFTMIELGAGFGRWVVRGGLAARQRGLPSRLIAVEAEPNVYGWLRQHFATNGLDGILIHAAISEIPDEVLFYVGGPRGGPFDRRPDSWYGQCITKDYDVASQSAPDGEYCGLRVLRHATGWRSVKVPSINLGCILEDLERVDLIDMDIEGQELSTVRTHIDALTAKVKRLHIGTHGIEIETGLRDLLRSCGWRCTTDYSLFTTQPTPWGQISFENGVQAWVNEGRVAG